MDTSLATINRGFVSIEEGQVHFREAGGHFTSRPLIMFHPSPTSSWILQPLMARLGLYRRVVALDTLGNGDSCLPAKNASLDIAYFSGAHLRAIDSLGIDVFDAYGSHTGGNIAAELAIIAPDRIESLILDGIAVYTPSEQTEMLKTYAPEIIVDHNGSQLNWAWHFVRDNYLFWPWFKRDAEHNRNLGLPSPEILHEKVLEVLKAVQSYHHSYRASFAYDKRARLPLVNQPVLLSCAEDDMLLKYMKKVEKLMPNAKTQITPGMSTPKKADRTVSLFLDFLK